MQHPLIAKLAPEWPQDLAGTIRESLISSGRTIVVLDDDPTGTQTVHDVPVLARFDIPTLQQEFNNQTPVVFLTTNSRSMSPEKSKALHKEIINSLRDAAKNSGRELEVISRSDSTLRGHFPLETDVIAEHWPEQSDIVLLMPFFQEGMRLTIHGQHYVGENNRLIPAHQTPFANDRVFGFAHSQMAEYVEEKTQGRISAEDVVLIPIRLIRETGPDGVVNVLESAPSGAVCVADSVTDRDAQVVALAVAQCGRRILARVAASYVRARSGLQPTPLLTSAQLTNESPNGGLVIVGSHVPKTTSQLDQLVKSGLEVVAIELPITEVLDSTDGPIDKISNQINKSLENGNNVVLYTSRDVVVANTDEQNLEISESVSSALVDIVRKIEVRPKFLVAKGGITSSDIAMKAIKVERAIVAGSILPGVPVWRLGDETRFSGLHYVVFPGNVGNDEALLDVVRKLSQ